MKHKLFFFALVALALIGCNQNEPIVKEWNVEFSYTIDSNNPLKVDFRNTSKSGITVVYWDFGDGTKSYDTNPTHTYSNAGTYKVTLFCRIEELGNIEATKERYVTVGDQQPSQPEINPNANKTPYIVGGNYTVGTLGKKYYLEIHNLGGLLFQTPTVTMSADNFYHFDIPTNKVIKIEPDDYYFVWLNRYDEPTIASILITAKDLAENDYPTKIQSEQNKPNKISITIEYR